MTYIDKVQNQFANHARVRGHKLGEEVLHVHLPCVLAEDLLIGGGSARVPVRHLQQRQT